MTARPKITHAALLAKLFYNPETGEWTNRKTGKRVGSLVKRRTGRLYGVVMDCYSHILAWFYMTKRWPRKQIDHKDNVACGWLSDRWSNLRLASNSENQKNAKCREDNVSGHKGIYLNKHGLYRANVWLSSKKVRSSLHFSMEAAIAWRAETAKRLHGEFAR